MIPQDDRKESASTKQSLRLRSASSPMAQHDRGNHDTVSARESKNSAKDFSLFPLRSCRSARPPPLHLFVGSSPGPFLFSPASPTSPRCGADGREIFIGFVPFGEIPDNETSRKFLHHRVLVYRSDASSFSPRSPRPMCPAICAVQKTIDALAPWVV